MFYSVTSFSASLCKTWTEAATEDKISRSGWLRWLKAIGAENGKLVKRLTLYCDYVSPLEHCEAMTLRTLRQSSIIVREEALNFTYWPGW